MPRPHDDDLDREIEDHLDLEAEELRDRGLSDERARDAARRAFGNATRVREDLHDLWRRPWLDAFVQDARFGVRLLIKTPVFTLFAVASLALGIGATSAIFTLFDAIVVRPLPVAQPERLVLASFGGTGGRYNYSMPFPQFAAMREQTTTLDGLFAISTMGRVSVTYHGAAEVADGQLVTGDYHRTLGLTPALGRLLTADDDRPGQTVAVISHAYWQSRFGGDPQVLGAAVTLNGLPFTIVGVEPEGFSGAEVGRPVDITLPMRARDLLSEGEPVWDEAFDTWIYVLGRLKPSVSIEQAQRELDPIFLRASLAGAHSPRSVQLARDGRLRLEPGATGASSDLRFRYERWLRVVLALLGAVLLLASLNVATLLLSRSETRRREIATRVALGAGRRRIVRQLLTESLVLASLAAAAGGVLSWWGSRTMLRVALPAAEKLPIDVSPDVRVIAFTLAVAGLTCLLFGVAPAWRVTSGLAAPRQVGGGRQRRLLDRALVATQVALSLVLLVVAGLFLRTLSNLWAQDPGYDRRQVLLFSVDPHLTGKTGDDVTATFRRLLDGLGQIPGVSSGTLAAVRPVSESYYFVSVVTAIGDRALGDARLQVAYNSLAPGYFRTLGIPLVAGRDFDQRDMLHAPKVAIISALMARHFTGNPIGQRITMAEGDVREVIGIARDSRYANVKEAPRDVVYLPIFQTEGRKIWYTPTFLLRYQGTAEPVLAAARVAAAEADAGLTLFNVRSLVAQTEDSLSRERLLAMLTSYVGAFALLLASIGLYGLMSYGVTLRTSELGVRLALGAPPATVRWLVVREGSSTVLIGVLVGLAASFGVVGLLRSQLFDVEPGDPATLATATFVLLAVALLACLIPARRASHINPMTALQHE